MNTYGIYIYIFKDIDTWIYEYILYTNIYIYICLIDVVDL